LRAFEARSLTASWEAARRTPSAAEWARARESLREARALDPAHPAYAEEIGNLYGTRALRLAPGDSLAADYARQALPYHRDAARLRPSASYSWANIALMKARLPEADAEFETALRNAVRLGPWEPEVQLAVADAGLSLWDRLSPAARGTVRDNLARTLKWQDAKAFALARRTGRLQVLCGLPEVARTPLATACI